MIDAQKLNGGSSHNNIILEVDRSSLEAGTNTIITKKKKKFKIRAESTILESEFTFPEFWWGSHAEYTREFNYISFIEDLIQW